MRETEPDDYAETLNALKRRVHGARFTLQRRANAELIALYWHIGDIILRKQEASIWRSGSLARLADDLYTEFPTMRGLSRSNLLSMRTFAATWPERNGIVHQPVGQLPWTHIVVLLEKLDEQPLREWYAGKDVQHTWNRTVLLHQISTRLHERDGAAPSNFAAALAGADSDLAQQIKMDPFTLGFLGVDSDLGDGELEVSRALRIEDVLRELGSGFAFIGTRYHVTVNAEDLSIDFLFFHVVHLRYIVLEFNARGLDSQDADQLGFYVELVDERFRVRDRHAPTMGILLATKEKGTVARYCVAGSSRPMPVSRDELSAAEQAALPSEASLRKLATAASSARDRAGTGARQ